MIEVGFERDEKLLKFEFERGIRDVAVLYANFAALVSGIGVVLLIAGMDKLVSWLVFGLGILIFLGAVGGIALYRYKKYKLAVSGEKKRATLTVGDTVIYSSDGEEREYSYKEFFAVKETAEYILPYLTKYEFLTLPKSAPNAAEAVELFKQNLKNANAPSV